MPEFLVQEVAMQQLIFLLLFSLVSPLCMIDNFHTQRPITLYGQNDTNQRLAVYVRFRMIVNLHRTSPFLVYKCS